MIHYRPYGKYLLKFILVFIALEIFTFIPLVINPQIVFSLELEIYQKKDKIKYKLPRNKVYGILCFLKNHKQKNIQGTTEFTGCIIHHSLRIWT